MAALAHDTVALLRSRPGFRRLWAAGITTQLGDWVGWVAVSVFTLHAGGGALGLALVFAIHHLPAAVLAPVAGPVVDRWDRRTVLVVTSAVLAVLTVGMAVAAGYGELLALQGLLLVRSAAVAFVSPAERAALPRLVRSRELLLAGSFDAGSWSVVFSVGMALGGVLTVLGPAVALGIDAASFLAAAVLFARLPPLPPAHDSEATPSDRGGLLDAIAWLRGRPRLQLAVLAKTPVAFAGGAAWLLIGVHVEAWAAAGLGFGLVHAVRGIGSGIGPVVAARFVNTEADRMRVWPRLMMAGATGTLLLAVSSDPALVGLAALLWGIAAGANWVLSAEAQQRLAPDHVLGRLSALDSFGFASSMCAGALFVGAATDLWGAGATALVTSTVAAALGWTLLYRRALR
jgi:predicted MFS family arabinose efflux permease